MDEFYLYLDECLPQGDLLYFSLCGCIIKKEDYLSLCVEINKLKVKIFETTSIIFHEIDLRKCSNGLYGILQNKEKRETFWHEMHRIIKASNFSVIGACVKGDIEKVIYRSKHTNPNYFVALQVILENFTYFLEQNSGIGAVYIESVNPKQDTLQHKQFNVIKNNGTLFLKRNAYGKYLTTANFVPKADNNIGLQIADLIPNAMNRHYSGMKQKTPSLFELFDSKIYDGSQDLESK